MWVFINVHDIKLKWLLFKLQSINIVLFIFLFCVPSVFVSYVEAAEMGFPWRVAGVSLEIG